MFFDTQDIERGIPHRGDMRLIDEVRDCTDTHGVGVKHVTDNEFWCSGHFPGSPIMPGVLQIEAMAQTASFVTLNALKKPGALGYFTSIEKARFIKMVKPGDTLELHVDLILSKMNLYKYHGIAMVNGEKVAEATFSAILDVK